MIQVSVDLVSLGIEDSPRNRSLGTMEIELIGGSDSTVVKTKGAIGDYRYRIYKWGAGKRVWKSGIVTGHDRKKRGPWDLLCLCLVAAVGDRVGLR